MPVALNKALTRPLCCDGCTFWDDGRSDKAEHALLSIARQITVTLVLSGLLLGCCVSCRSQLLSSHGEAASRVHGEADGVPGEERERLRAVD